MAVYTHPIKVLNMRQFLQILWVMKSAIAPSAKLVDGMMQAFDTVMASEPIVDSLKDQRIIE